MNDRLTILAPSTLFLAAATVLAGVAVFVNVTTTYAQPPDTPFTLDEATFNQHFFGSAQGLSEEELKRSEAPLAEKIRELTQDNTLTEDQIDRLRMAGYSDISRGIRGRFDARRKMVGKEYPNLGAVFTEYEAYISGGAEPLRQGSLMLKVFKRALTAEQKNNLLISQAKRRARLADATILHGVSLLSLKMAMTVPQQVALAKLINKEMPPAKLYSDDHAEAVLRYTMAVLPDEELAAIFDEIQLEELKPRLEEGFDQRTGLREAGVLEAITKHRAALQATEEEPQRVGKDGGQGSAETNEGENENK